MCETYAHVDDRILVSVEPHELVEALEARREQRPEGALEARLGRVPLALKVGACEAKCDHDDEMR